MTSTSVVDLNLRATGSRADKVPFHKPVLLQFDQGTDFNGSDAGCSLSPSKVSRADSSSPPYVAGREIGGL